VCLIQQLYSAVIVISITRCLTLADSGTVDSMEAWCVYVLQGILDELSKVLTNWLIFLTCRKISWSRLFPMQKSGRSLPAKRL